MAHFDQGRFERRFDATSWSFPSGQLIGIRIRIHYLFPLLAASELYRTYPDLRLGLAIGLFLGLIVLLHEIGHCLGCRAVGGEADEILLWPLGGLAYCRPPHRSWETLITALAGPAVNVVIFLILLPVLQFQGALDWSLLHPFEMILAPGAARYTSLLFKLNYLLLLFNLLLPFYPLDGGLVVQSILWHRLGYYQATLISSMVGMIGGGLAALLGVFLCGWYRDYSYSVLTAIGVWGVIECRAAQRQLEVFGQWGEGELGYDFSQGYTSLERSLPKRPRESWKKRVLDWYRRRQEQRGAVIEADLDRLLQKIHDQGIESLSRAERKRLQLASRLRRSRSDP